MLLSNFLDSFRWRSGSSPRVALWLLLASPWIFPLGAIAADPLPGTAPRSAALEARLAAALEARGADYRPRTEHRDGSGRPLYLNRLILEDSPYLLQHAHNPVNWFPWGEEAFAEARRRNKLIFLSIGYSTCHWCHVMERESFDDPEIARLMNQHFVCVKVDRERRPDIDEIYMTAVQITTGQGGWPMSTFLLADGSPLFGATYFPPDRFRQLLTQVSRAWDEQRPELEATAARVTAAVARATAASGQAKEVGREQVAQARDQLMARHDRVHGGLGKAPKFPHEPELLFLLQWAEREGDEAVLEMVRSSLEAMARGGLHDQVGGGFHRYTIDAGWRIPHFEKMLYNQAQLARAYSAAFRLTGDPYLARVARQTLDYVLRDMTSSQGTFHSATDADSEGREGAFFVWNPAQLARALGNRDAALAGQLFGVTPEGNFEGSTVLHVPRPFATSASALGVTEEALWQRIERVRERLREVRARRPAPLLDDKVMVAWNGMMITALAEASLALDDDTYRLAAERAGEVLWQTMRRGGRRGSEATGLWRIEWQGRTSVAALLDDYAHLLEAFLALYDGRRDERWLVRARWLADRLIAEFGDDAAGGFFMTPEDAAATLITRPKSPADGAVPSGNSVAVRALARLFRRTGDATYRRWCNSALGAFAGALTARPQGFPYLLMGLDDLRRGETGGLEYGAGGVVAARGWLAPRGDGWDLVVDLEVQPGWHVNSATPRQPRLLASRLDLGSEAWRLGEILWPAAEEVRLAFQEEPLDVYQGRARITAPLLPVAGEASIDLRARLRLQACDDRRCLAPEVLELEIAPPPSERRPAKP
ncbi:MAG: DUF255 domain-containing protein [Acidobacteriota bacterium]